MSILTRLSLANRLIVGLVTAAILGFGLFAAGSLKQELLPSIQQPGATIVAAFAGASPASVEKEVTEPIERVVRSVKGVTSVDSTSMNGTSTLQVRWDFGLDSEKIVSDVRGALSGVKSTLPAGVTSEVYAGNSDDLPVMLLAVASDDDASEFAKQVNAVVLPALRGIDGVRQVQLSGEHTTQLMITLRPADLAAKKVTADEVIGTITASGVVVAAGTSQDAGVQLSIEVGNAISSIDDVKNLPVQHADGPFALSSVADVEQVAAEQTSIARSDGLPSLSLSVLKDPDANAIQVAHAVSAMLPGLEKELGKGASFATVFDQSPMVEQSIHDLSVEGGLGLVFAIIVILVFLLSIRSTIITAVSIPLSLLIALIGLWVGDYSLNIFTLAALTVAVGRVVDDSIVVIENIKRRHSGIRMTAESVVGSVREVAGAVTASTLTTVAVFLPVAFVGGTTGELFRPFAVTVSIALAASLIVSLTIVPVLAFWFMSRPSRREKRAQLAAEGLPVAAARRAHTDESAQTDESEAYSAMQRGYLPVLRATLRRPVVTLVVATAIFVGTVVAGGFLKMDYLGSFGNDATLQLSQELPVGTSLELTSDAAARVEGVLAETAGVTGYLTTIGDGGSNSASITVNLDPNAPKGEVQADIEKGVEALSEVGTVTVGSPDAGLSSGGIAVTVQGDDPVALAAGAAEVQKVLSGVQGLGNVTSDLADEQAILKVSVDRAAAARYGFTQAQVGQAISDALRGTPVGTIVLEGTTRDIIVRAQGVGATPAEISALPLPVSALQQASAQKAATDRLTAEQDAATLRAQDNARAETAKTQRELRTGRADAVAQLGRLTGQLEALAGAPVLAQPVDPAVPTPDELARQRAEQERVAQMSGLQDAIGQLRSAITGFDDQLTSIARSVDEAAAQQAEADEFRRAQENLANVTAVPITVKDVAQVERQNAPAAIMRVDGVRTVTVSAEPTGDDLGAASLAIRTGLDRAGLPSGVTAQLGGVAQDQEESFGQLGIAMLIAVILVYIVMVATFRSLLQPLILLVSVPFAATGAIAGLLLTGTPLGVPAMIGLLMLIGIVVTNAIVLIDLVNSYRNRGDSVDDAVLHGARIRLRPIIMTACATIFALLPMSIGLTGGGVFISQSLAIVVIGGLISSTLLTLILVPVLYTVVERRAQRRRDRRAAGSPGPEHDDGHGVEEIGAAFAEER